MRSSHTLQPGQPFTVAMLLFPGVTQLDLTAPLEVFGRVRGVSYPAPLVR
jgi:hypothetical protein